jgi:hypothetical protein
MTIDSKRLTPDDTNIVETAHSSRNSETSIRAPLLVGIIEYICFKLLRRSYTFIFTTFLNDRSRSRDEAIADKLEALEAQGVYINKWNGPLHRERRSANRRASNRIKFREQNEATDKYEALEAELLSLSNQRKESLAWSKITKTRLESLGMGVEFSLEREQLKCGIQHALEPGGTKGLGHSSSRDPHRNHCSEGILTSRC